MNDGTRALERAIAIDMAFIHGARAGMRASDEGAETVLERALNARLEQVRQARVELAAAIEKEQPNDR